MLKKRYRLARNYWPRDGAFFSDYLFNARVSSNSLSISRFGFVVSKKQERRAVDRNRARRVFRSVIEQHVEGFSGGIDVLFFLKNNLRLKKRQDIEKELLVFFKKSGLIK